MSLLEDLKWRYATKKFDSEKKISTADLEILKEAVSLSASSFGLQPYKVLIIEDKAIRAQLVEHSWGQQQIVDASHLFVFCSYANATDADVDTFIQLIAKTRGVDESSLDGYGTSIKGFISNLPTEVKISWMQRQTYIAMGNLLNAAAALKIDACPMEGFVPEKYNELLGLKAKNLNAAVLVTAGYRHADDTYQHLAKVRKAHEDLFEVI